MKDEKIIFVDPVKNGFLEQNILNDTISMFTMLIWYTSGGGAGVGIV